MGLAGRSREEAEDVFLARIRTTLSCLADCSIFRSPAAPDRIQYLTAFERGTGNQNLLSLVTHEGTGDLTLRFAHLYRIEHDPDDQAHGPYTVRTVGYSYRVLDVEEREIALYHWHPEGNSPVLTPHLHVPSAAPMQMAQRFASSRKGVKTDLGSLHFPTAHIFLEDIAEFLIRDFAVASNRSDWQSVLQNNRDAIERGRTW